jgi:hypothetical protein
MFSRIILIIIFWFFIKIFVGIDAGINARSTLIIQEQHQINKLNINYFNHNETKHILVGSVGGK